MILAPFDVVECADVEEAVSLLHDAGDRARLIAGGTALVPLLKHRMVSAEVLVSVSRIPGLRRIEVGPDGALHVGSTATHRAVSRAAAIREHSPLLAEACGRVASPTIRAMGTLGGNLCYGESASDPSPALIALGAEVVVLGPQGRRRMAVEDLFAGFYETVLTADVVLEDIIVLAESRRRRWRYLKWTPRAQEDKALVGLAVVAETARQGRSMVCQSIRIGLGGVDPFPVRLRGAEHVLAGAEISQDVVARAAETAADEVKPFEDLQASADYRREMVRVWARRILSEVLEVA
jgi:carbon-monoxide dehydrogenase medium subunit